MARWDNIEILRAVDKHHERVGGGTVWGLNGCQLMDEVAGKRGLDDKLVREFLQELEILAAKGYQTSGPAISPRTLPLPDILFMTDSAGVLEHDSQGFRSA